MQNCSRTVSFALVLVFLPLAIACKQKPAEPTPVPPEQAPEQAAKPPVDPDAIPAPPDVAEPPADAERTASGLAWRVLQPGSGSAKPGATDLVRVHYTGWTTDGRMFDSSVRRGRKAQFALNRVIPGWTEGLQLMVEGEKRRFWIPANLAYGDTPSRPGAPAGLLVFDVELFDILKAPAAVPGPIPPPKDVRSAPRNAKKTASGISYVVLQKGAGTRHPAAHDEVAVLYTGWTVDGKMFDSALTRGEVAVFPLDRVIPGWTEGVQLMVEGEKTRFWIPGNLAYGDTPSHAGAPAGTLVFDIELVKILSD